MPTEGDESLTTVVTLNELVQVGSRRNRKWSDRRWDRKWTEQEVGKVDRVGSMVVSLRWRGDARRTAVNQLENRAKARLSQLVTGKADVGASYEGWVLQRTLWQKKDTGGCTWTQEV